MNIETLQKKIAELEKRLTQVESGKPGKLKQLFRSFIDNRFLYISLGVCLLLTPLAVYAAMEDMHVFTKGEVISSSEMNYNFQQIKDKIGEIEVGTAVWNKDEITGNLRYLDGNVGIGLENPLSPLQVAGNVEADSFSIKGEPVGSSQDSYWSVGGPVGSIQYSGGNVGIGTGDPSELFVVGDDFGELTIANSVVIGDSDSNPLIAVGNDNSNYNIIQWVGGADDYLTMGGYAGGIYYPDTLVLKNGYVGIGTTTPQATLEVRGGAEFGDGSTKIAIFGTGDVNYIESGNNAFDESKLLHFTGYYANPGTFAFNGNVGIGISSLESWGANYTALQLGGNASFLANTGAGSGAFDVSQDAWFDGTNWKYQNTYGASNYAQSAGTHKWRVASSGTADTNISWTTAMVIDETGNVGIGIPNPGEKLEIEDGDIKIYSNLGTSNTVHNGIILGTYGASGNEVKIRAYQGNFSVRTGILFNTWQDNEVNAMFINSNGYVGIGDVNTFGIDGPNVRLDVLGDIEATGSITEISDIRLKENINTIKNPINKLSTIKGIYFNKIGSKRKQLGVIAQDVRKSLPEAVSIVDPDKGHLGVSYNSLVPVLIEAVKELEKQNNSIKSKKDSEISELKAENEELITRLARIEKMMGQILAEGKHENSYISQEDGYFRY
jgi:hypothetical protein